MTEQNYPIGLQDFAEIRQSGKVYIDKTSSTTHNISKWKIMAT